MFDFEILNYEFLVRIALNVLGLSLLLYPGFTLQKSRGGSAFIYYMFGNGVFFATYVLRLVEMSLGFAFGLFAIFSMLRYRTESLTTRDMTYLFLVIVNSLLCAVGPLNPLELLCIVAIMAALSFLADRLLMDKVLLKEVRYDRIENIRPENHAALLQDLRERTGLDIEKVAVKTMDFMQDSAQLLLYYRPGTRNGILVGGPDAEDVPSAARMRGVES